MRDDLAGWEQRALWGAHICDVLDGGTNRRPRGGCLGRAMCVVLARHPCGHTEMELATSVQSPRAADIKSRSHRHANGVRTDANEVL